MQILGTHSFTTLLILMSIPCLLQRCVSYKPEQLHTLECFGWNQTLSGGRPRSKASWKLDTLLC